MIRRRRPARPAPRHARRAQAPVGARVLRRPTARQVPQSRSSRPTGGWNPMKPPNPLSAACHAARGRDDRRRQPCAADACSNRGELDAMYCDANKDHGRRRADRSQEVEKPVDDRLHVHARSRTRRFTRTSSSRSRRYLAQCLDKKVVFYQVQNNAAEIEAMRSRPAARRRLLDRPDRVRGQSRRRDPVRGQGQRQGIPGLQPDRHRRRRARRTRSSSDLKGKKVAHTAPSSNSGHLAPLALFPARRPRRPTRTTRSSSPASTTSRCSASIPATTTPRPSPPTSSTGWACAARSRKPTSASSTAARSFRRRRSRMRTISSRSSPTRC